MTELVRSRQSYYRSLTSPQRSESSQGLVTSCEKTWSFKQPNARAAAEEFALREYCKTLRLNLYDADSPVSRTISADAKLKIEAKMTLALAQLKSQTADLDRKKLMRARAEIESMVLEAQGPFCRTHRELGPFVAICVGNTATVSACYQRDDIIIVRNDDDGKCFLSSYPTTPDVIRYMPNLFTAPVSPISAARRLLEPTHTVDDEASRDFPTLFQSADPHEQQVQATKLFTRIFRRVLANVEALQCGEVHDAVLVVPAGFTWDQRERLRRAAVLAGLANVLTVNDAVASAVCHIGETIWSGVATQTAIVLHVGGHTIDAAILTGRNSVLKLRALAGFTSVGGEQFTNRLVKHCCEDFFHRTGYNLLEGENCRCRVSLCRLRAACDEAKRQLSSQTSAVIEVPKLLYNFDYLYILERSVFEQLNADLFVKCLQAVSEVSTHARISKRAINHVVLEGGSAVIPRLREMLVAHFEGRVVHLHCKHTNSCESVLQVSSTQTQAVGAIHFQRSTLMEAKPISVIPVEATTDYAKVFTYRKG